MHKTLLLLLGVILLAGCSEPDRQTKDISGLMPSLEFKLTSEEGKTVRAEDYRGQVTLLFFGFTHCHDVCPTTLAHLAAVADELGEEARDGLRVLFVSVDPARDDSARLGEFTDNFGSKFIGLTGDRAALDALTRRYRVTYGYGDRDEAGNYAVSHPSAVFAFDREGKAQLLIRDDDPMEAVVADLRQLLKKV